MAQREWVEKDFYKELGVSSDASPDEIKRAARKLAPRTAPGPRTRTTRRPKNGSRPCPRPQDVLTDPAKRKEYDETRRLFAGGGFGGRRFDTSGFGGRGW